MYGGLASYLDKINLSQSKDSYHILNDEVIIDFNKRDNNYQQSPFRCNWIISPFLADFIAKKELVIILEELVISIPQYVPLNLTAYQAA